jgi:hypothetical protein
MMINEVHMSNKEELFLNDEFDNDSSVYEMNGSEYTEDELVGKVLKKIFVEGKDIKNKGIEYNSTNKILKMTCSEKLCKAEYEFELKESNKIIDISYRCRFCNKMLFSIKDNVVIIPKNINIIPPDHIALPGIIYLTLDDYLNNYYSLLYKHYAIRSKNLLEFFGKENEKDISEFILIRICFLHNAREVHIPNICMAEKLKHKGIGKTMISLIFKICEQFEYRLFIVDIVDSFYTRMLRRGALRIDEDTVEIINNTDLEIH